MIRRIGTAIALLLLTLAVVACGDDAAGSRGTAEVTLDAFSGLPNPTWTIDVEQAAEFVSMWDGLATTATTEYPDQLGYRAVIVELGDGSTMGGGGGAAVDFDTGNARADTGRTLERWIIETGRGTVDEAVLDNILAEVAG